MEIPQWPISGSLRRGLALTALSLAALAAPLGAQELQRYSLAGSTAAEAGRTASQEENNYNLKVGPVRFLASVYAGFEFNDNIGYSENKTSDVAVRFGINLKALWNLTRLNTLALDIGLGFQRYIDHPEVIKGNIFITPNSQVSFDVYVADIFRINFHDRFEIRQDPLDAPTLSNIFTFGRFLNTAGVTVVGDFNTLVATVGYDHFNYISLTRRFNYLDRADEQFNASLVYQVAPRFFLGVEATGSVSSYRRTGLNDSVGASFGGYVDIALTPYLRAVARAGYEYRGFETGGVRAFGDTEDLSSFYASLQVTHRVNAYITQTLSLGRTNELGYFANYNRLYYVRYGADWRVANRATLHGEAFYEDVRASGGLVREELQRYGFGAALTYDFTLKLSATARYGYVHKDSNFFFNDYTQNRVNIDMNYRF